MHPLWDRIQDMRNATQPVHPPDAEQGGVSSSGTASVAPVMTMFSILT